MSITIEQIKKLSACLLGGVVGTPTVSEGTRTQSLSVDSEREEKSGQIQYKICLPLQYNIIN
jgi:hypothetical protein